MTKQQIIDKWNNEADGPNQWDNLSGDEKIELLRNAEDCTIKDLSSPEAIKAADDFIRIIKKETKMKKKYSAKEKSILNIIGFALLKYNNNNYVEVYKFIDALGITNIKYLKDEGEELPILTITLNRPGLFIGAKGEQIAFIKKELETFFKTQITLSLIEDDIYSHLYPSDLNELGSF